MRWCISEHGNLSLESPGSNQLIEPFKEGYAVCSQNPGGQLTHGYDAGHIEGPFPGWGPAAVTFPTAASAQVVRTTPDGKLQLSMKFTRDSKTLDVLIATTVTNISPQRLVDVRYTRYSSNDTMASYHDRTASSAWWRRDDFGSGEPPAVGLALSMPTNLAGVLTRTYQESPLVWFDAPFWCVPTPNQVMAAPGVGGGALFGAYFLGDLNPGQKKTVTHVYRRL